MEIARLLATGRMWVGRLASRLYLAFPFLVRRPIKARRRRRTIKRTWGLPELLDSLEADHERFALRLHRQSNVHKYQWKGLKALGTYVCPHPGQMDPASSDLFTIPSQWGTWKFPQLMNIGFRQEHRLSEIPSGYIGSTAIWAIRQKKAHPDWRIEKTPGILYLIGASYEEGKKEYLLCAYVSVDLKARVIHVPKMLHDIHVPLPSGGVYCRRQWSVPGVAGVEEYEKHAERYVGMDDYLSRMLVSAFRACMELWQERTDYYQVVTRKSKSRVVFCIAKGEQRFFFKDRDRTVLAADGKRKRIVHYVAPFTRHNGQAVKEHLRGIRRFTWAGYDISLILPAFHIAVHEFDLDPKEEEEMVPGTTYLGLAASMGKLARAEEETEYRHGQGWR